MKTVLYKDESGLIMRSLVRDSDSESDAPFGIPLGPPDLHKLDWDRMMREINAVLVQQGAFSWADAQNNSQGILGAINVFKRHLIALYRELDDNHNQATD
jgi:hypothetical protein